LSNIALICSYRTDSGLSFRIAPHQIGNHFGHFLRDQAKGNRLHVIVLPVVTEADRLKFIDRFARFVHRLDVVFVSARGDVRPAESAVAVYRYQIWVGSNLRLNVGIDLADKTAVVHVLACSADGNHAVSGIDGGAGEDTQGDITVAGTVVSQRFNANGCVGESCGIVKKRPMTNGRVGSTSCVVKKGLVAVGCVEAARIAARLVGGVGRPGIAKKRERPSGRISVTRCIA
jgi:hypothetical protein